MQVQTAKIQVDGSHRGFLIITGKNLRVDKARFIFKNPDSCL